MQRARRERLIRSFFELASARRLDEQERLVHRDCVWEADPPLRPSLVGPAGCRAILEDWFAAFPDLTLTVEAVEHQAAPVAVARVRWRGTHRATLRFAGHELSPKGNRIDVVASIRCEAADGQITALRTLRFDKLAESLIAAVRGVQGTFSR
jgi:ketosteroid isomerase-like protein